VARLGAVLFLLVVVMAQLMDVRSVWSGGVQWTASGGRLGGEWMDNGETPVTEGLTGQPLPDVAIGAHHYTDKLMAADWELGISDFLADLAPNTASFTFVGQVTAVPGDEVVVTTGWGVQWVGRVDTKTETRDVNGDYWTTVTATDTLGALGAATLVSESSTTGFLDDVLEGLALESGVALDIVDASGGLAVISSFGSFSMDFDGTVLAYMNLAARSGNAMLALTRDGTIHAMTRQGETPSSVLTLTGVDAPASWALHTSIDVDINWWELYQPNGSVVYDSGDNDDVALYGKRSYSVDQFLASNTAFFSDWINYGGSQRPVASGELIVSAWSQDDLILLDPFQWVTESGTAWQVMSVKHSVTPSSWRVSITADNLLDLL
jgi:hypothetical protein